MKKTGFYIIKDKFFEEMLNPYLKGNKAGEGINKNTAGEYTENGRL